MRSRHLLRFLGVAAALALAYGAQYLFDHPDALSAFDLVVPFESSPTFKLAAAGLLFGAILFAVSAPANRQISKSRDQQSGGAADQPVLSHVTAPSSQPTARAGTASAFSASALLLLALAAYAANAVLYLLRGESALVRWLWVGSAAVLALSQVPWTELRGVAGRWRREWTSYLLPAALLLLAASLRFYHLADLPQDLHGDMASHGLQALAILDGQVSGIVSAGWADIPMPGFLPTVAAMVLTGDRGTFGLAFASAVGGVLSVWGLWVLLNETQGRRVAWIGTALLAVAYTHVHFSRIAEYMDPVPFAIWAVALLAIGLRTGRSLPFLLSGMLMALASLMYYSGRIVLAVVAVFLLYLLLVDRRLLWENRRGLGWTAAGFVVGLGPILFFFAQEPVRFLSRTREVFVFNPPVLEHLGRKYGVEGRAAVLAEQARRSLLMFNYSIDSSTQFGFSRPIVDSVTAPLVVLGFGFAMAHGRRWANGLLAVFLATILVAGSILTDNAAFWPRLVLILLPAAGLAALAVDRAWQAAIDAFGREVGQIVSIVAIGGLIYAGLVNLSLYVPAASHNGRPRALVGRYAATLPADATVCLVGEDESDPSTWIHSVGEREIAFLLAPRAGIDLSGDDLVSMLRDQPACGQSGAAWIVPASRATVLRELQVRFPGAPFEPHGARLGETAFYSLRVP